MARLFERERELEALGELLKLAATGSGRVVLVLGAAGIGKTGLLTATAAEARTAGFVVCEAVTGELERDLAWGVVRQLFTAAMRAWAQSDRDLFAGAAELALPVLGLGQAAPGVDTLSPALHGLYWLTANLSERGPVLLMVDDAQWADAASLGFLHYLAARLEDLPVLLVVAIRTGDPAADDCETMFRGAGRAMVLQPAPLSVEATERMLAVVIQRSPEPEFARACHAATGGNPFLLSELTAQLVADGIEPTADSASRLQQVSPRSVSRWVVLRLSRLPPAARRLAEAVAVLGGTAQLAVAAALADVDVTAAGGLADALWAAGVLDAGVPPDFVHPLVRAAVYAEISPFARDAAHARAARLIARHGGEPGAVAAQIMQIRPARDQWVIDTLIDAANSARERGASEEAVAWLHRALAEPPAPERRADVLFQLGTAEADLAAPAALEHLRAAHELATDPVARAAVALALARLLVVANQPAQASDLAQDTLSDVMGCDRELELQLEAFLMEAGFHDSAVRATSRGARTVAEDLAGETPGERMVLGALAAKYTFSAAVPASRATRLVSRAVAYGWLAEQSDLRWWQAMYILHVADELDLAERLETQALQQARNRGSIFGVCLAATYRAHIYLLQGRLLEAEAEIDYANSFADHVWPGGIPVKIHIAIDVLVEQGRLAEADREAARVGAIDVPRTLLTPLYAICSRGRLRIAQGRFEEALSDLFAVGRYSPASNPAMFAWRSYAAPALASLGRCEEARELLAQELQLAHTFGVARAIGVNLRAAGVLENGEAGIELLRQSIAVLERCPSRLERAHSLIEHGSMLRRHARRAESLPSLRQGLELADQAGAHTLAQRARRELSDAGARPHRPARIGRDTLTPSERRVAQMAADGATNKQIAQGLFISLRTVETHLTHTYAKLGITARTELSPALAASVDQPHGSAVAASSRS